jgi:nitrile hydratase
VTPRFHEGQAVRVQAWTPPGHVRTPFYTRGHRGRVIGLAAIHPNPQTLAYGRNGQPFEPVYRVRFPADELWPGGRGDDAVVADLQESWLEAAP